MFTEQKQMDLCNYREGGREGGREEGGRERARETERERESARELRWLMYMVSSLSRLVPCPKRYIL